MLQELFDGRGHLLRGGGEAEFDLNDAVLEAQEVLLLGSAVFIKLPGGLGPGGRGDGLVRSPIPAAVLLSFLSKVQQGIEPEDQTV